MKKSGIVILILAFLLGSQAIAKIAEQVMPIVDQAPKPDTVQTTREVSETKIENEDSVSDDKSQQYPEEIQSKLTDDIIKDLRTCKPQDEKYDFDFLGLNLSFFVKINGWVDDKCEYHMSAKVRSLGEDFRKSFGITAPDEKISKVEPKVQCAFTKKQLDILVDAIVEEDKRNVEQINQMLKNPDTVLELPNSDELTKKEKKLMDMLAEDNVCAIVNIDELIQQFGELVPEPKK